MQYFQYLDKYREYQRFDTSIEEVSIYHGAMTPPSIVTIPVLIPCSLQLIHSTVDNYCTVRDSNKKARHIKACQTNSKHIFLGDSGPPKRRGMQVTLLPS